MPLSSTLSDQGPGSNLAIDGAGPFSAETQRQDDFEGQPQPLAGSTGNRQKKRADGDSHAGGAKAVLDARAQLSAPADGSSAKTEQHPPGDSSPDSESGSDSDSGSEGLKLESFF